MDRLRLDLRQALRAYRSAPGVSLAAVLMLAVGISANTAVFSAVSALLLRPLPVRDIDRVVSGVSLRAGFDPLFSGLIEYEALRAESLQFASVGAAAQRAVNLAFTGEPERVTAADVTASYFDVLDAAPLVGRRLSQQDDRPGAAPVALIGYDLWRRRFNHRPDIVGQTMKTDDRVLTIVGVMPAGFDQPAHAELWMPARLALDPLPIENRMTHNWDIIARLAPGATLDGARARVRVLAGKIASDHPQFRRGWGYDVRPLRRQLIGDFDGRSGRTLLLLAVAVGFLLLICCANAAGLLLVRGIARQREIAVRLALGSGRRRIVRQLLTESALLAVLAGCAGLLFTAWTVPLLAAFNPIRAGALGALLTDFRIDWRVLAFTLTVTVLSALAFGVVPAMGAIGRGDLASALKRREQRATGEPGSRRWMRALVVGEIALAAAMLVGGGLVMQSFDRLRRVDLGFQPDRLMATQVALSPVRYADQVRRADFVSRALAGIRVLPGVEAAGASTNLPLDDLSFDAAFSVEGRPPVDASQVPITAHRLVTPGYLEALGVRLRQGRLIDDRDTADAPPAVVVTEAFAREAWPDVADPIGRRVRRAVPRESPWMTVVGVVADVKEDQFNFRIDRPAWYVPYAQVTNSAPVNLLVRTRLDSAALAMSIRQIVRPIDPDQPLAHFRRIADQVAVVTRRDRFSAVLTGALAAVGAALAAFGLYAVVSYSISQRQSEFALRMALGATPRDLLRLVLGESGALIAAGVVIGLAGARLLASGLGAFLFEIRPGDPLTFVSAAGAVIGVGLLASFAPARRAASIEPSAALRGD
jgi:putative ABC transport system permease protein